MGGFSDEAAFIFGSERVDSGANVAVLDQLGEWGNGGAISPFS
jgi:hypothetical protein